MKESFGGLKSSKLLAPNFEGLEQGFVDKNCLKINWAWRAEWNPCFIKAIVIELNTHKKRVSFFAVVVFYSTK